MGKMEKVLKARGKQAAARESPHQIQCWGASHPSPRSGSGWEELLPSEEHPQAASSTSAA